jgi:hypothetical protein
MCCIENGQLIVPLKLVIEYFMLARRFQVAFTSTTHATVTELVAGNRGHNMAAAMASVTKTLNPRALIMPPLLWQGFNQTIPSAFCLLTPE